MRVVVLMSTYNGEKYLMEQLNSLYNQEEVEVEILVRDDGSSDSTQRILQEEQEKGKLTWYTGENLRPAKSFLNLVGNAPQNRFYAFCDQDDVWLPDKLKIAVEWLAQQDSEKPLLYYGCTRLVDDQLKTLAKQPRKEHMITFESMLVDSQCTGCTMVFNDVLLNLAKKSVPDFVSMHDAWLHKICITMNGVLHYDEDVHILYRQHGSNVVGANQSHIAKFRRRVRSLYNAECQRSKMATELLKCFGNEITSEQRSMIEEVANYKSSITGRLTLFFDRRIKTGYLYRDVMYKLAVLVGAF